MDAFKTRLLQLECHFTWALREEDFNLHDLVNRLQEQIELESGEARVTRAYSSLAFVCYLYGDLQAALSNLCQSEELAKKYYGEDSEKFLTVTYGDFAWLYYHMGNFTLAEDYSSLVERISMKFSNESSNEVHSEVLREKGWAFLKFSRKYYNGARECFRQALEMNPKDSDLSTGYAIALYRTTTDPPGSWDSPTLIQLRRAIDLNPKDAVLLVLLAIRLTDTKILDPKEHSEEAVGLMIRALKMSPENPHVMRYVAQLSRKLGSTDFAICQLEKALKHTPNSAFIHHQLALCYKSKKIALEKVHGPCHKVDHFETQDCLHKCIYHLEKAVSLKPLFIAALAELAVHYGQIDIPKAE
ncbi:interferon-induced protein with tetratricopeptide repeats 5-like, partial [Colossoma macropomum]|uniref:interferon-induced protein with tetratricopeptide repeats 5-like n=1 Tax=Colossoma macropomum TaxID=42526 RepID=UPI001863B9F1